MTWRGCLISIMTATLASAGVFDDAQKSGSAGEEKSATALNGSVRGGLYGGKVPDAGEGEIKSQFGEAALKLNISRGPFGNAFTELRFRAGNEYGTGFSTMLIREAYVNAYLGPMDVRMGKQIVAWGRADGINPTNNITPMNLLVYSPDEDDRREGNFLLRSFLNFQPIRIEGIWVPVYASSEIPLSMLPAKVPLRAGTAILELPITALSEELPPMKIQNSAGAFKLNLELPKFDGSLSYFYGYDPLPGISMQIRLDESGSFPVPAGIGVGSVPYRMHTLGADFSSTAGSFFGIRGEAAWRIPDEDYEVLVHVPHPDIQMVLGAEKEIGNLNAIFQYYGRYVIDFSEIEAGDPVALAEEKSRMFFSQQDELSHAFFMRLAWKLAHDLIILDITGMYNFTTEEVLLRPMFSYDLTDNLSASVGAEIYTGPEGTMYDLIEEQLSAGFVELKASF